ncbi:MAG: thiamine pyrophosphate-dependent dehydrogenase E1 component subunit alpha [Candidatus Omnitrophica bacterium]|nr:thiamine pyrophosphate-dependent dehydrogenase E1 component subunit alpha [Candidatus Omnitrophota bacterium]
MPKASAPTSTRNETPLGVGPAQALGLYRKLLLIRLAEERIRQEYFKDEMKTPVHLGIGEEAIPVGVCHAVPEGSACFGTYRNHSLFLAMTQDTDRFFGELYGKSTGPAKGKAGSMHLTAPEAGLMATSAVVGTTIPLAVGAALARAYRKEPALTVSFFGDGAVEEGVFWESLNFACLKRLKILFVCEDNGLAIHTPAASRVGFRSIPEALGGFRAQVASGDGSSLTTVIELARGLMSRMEEESQPGFLHLTYFRFLEHVGPLEDFDKGYRRKPTPEEMERWDPVSRFEKDLDDLGVGGEDRQRVRQEVLAQIDRSVRLAQAAPYPGVEELHTDVWA